MPSPETAPSRPWEISEETFQASICLLASLNLGFFIAKEELLWDAFESVYVKCVKIDRIGPPAAMHAWSAGPINDHLVSGHRAAFSKWVDCLCEFIENGRSDWHSGPH